MNVVTRRATRFPLRLEQMAPSASRLTPVGLGLDSHDVRLRMVQRLREGGARHHGVLQAMAAIARHEFLDTALVAQAYEDTSLPIGHGQTISKPSVVARMIELLFEGVGARASASLGRVLEIGTGCGYQAAVLSLLGSSVVSIERVKALHNKARGLLGRSRRDRVRLVYGDGMFGHPPNAPYDSIIAAAGGEHIAPAWLEQLAPLGRLVVPSRLPGSEQQVLVVVDRTEQGLRQSLHESVNFVALKSGVIG